MSVAEYQLLELLRENNSAELPALELVGNLRRSHPEISEMDVREALWDLLNKESVRLTLDRKVSLNPAV